MEETDVDVEVANDPIIVASVLTIPDIAPLVVKGTPLQEDVIPSDLPSMMRWFQGYNVKASPLDASRVVEKLVSATIVHPDQEPVCFTMADSYFDNLLRMTPASAASTPSVPPSSPKPMVFIDLISTAIWFFVPVLAPT